MEMKQEVNLIIQRVRDKHVLCATEMTDDEEPLFTEWFSPEHIPDDYGFLVFDENKLRSMGYASDESLQHVASIIVAKYVGELYSEGELEFLWFMPDTSEFPTMLQ